MIPEQQSSATGTEEDEKGIADQIRAGLEARVIELIVLGYERMRDDESYTPKWKENKYTAVLKGYIKKHCREFSKRTKRPWYIDREHYHDKEGVIRGDDDPDKVSRIDIIIVTWTVEYEEIVFPFEAKLLDQSAKLAYLYIKKGLIDRYLTEKDYAAGSSWGGMIGYIFEGRPVDAIEKINYQVERQLNKSNEYLKIHQSINQFDSVYISLHERPNTTKKLKITHLLLPFDAQESSSS